jgi:hypothetical protein
MDIAVINGSLQERLELYLSAIRYLRVKEDSLVWEDYEPLELLVANERGHVFTQTDHLHLNADPNSHASVWQLSGCAKFPNLLEINIECCPSNIRGLFGRESWGYAKFRKIHDLGDRSISAAVVIEDLRRLDWQESTLCLGGSSYLDELWLRCDNNRCLSPLLIEAEQLRKDATHRTRLHKLRRLNVEGSLSHKSLSFILTLCPEIERLNLDIDSLYHGNLQNSSSLTNWFGSGAHNLKFVEIRWGKLNWLPFLRRCQRVDLHCDGSPDVRSLGRKRDGSKRRGGQLESLTIHMPDLQADADAESIIGFIQAHTTSKTWIDVYVPEVEDDDDDTDSNTSASASDEAPGIEWMDDIRRSVAYLKEKEKGGGSVELVD